MHRRSFLSLPLLAAGPGCVTTSDPVRPPFKSVAIVTGFTDTLHLKYLPHAWHTIFGDVDDSLENSGWGVDAHIRAMLTERLKGTYDVKAVNYNPADVGGPATYALETTYIGSPTSETLPQIADRLQRVVPAGLADAIILIIPSKRGTSKKDMLIGIGLVSGRNLIVSYITSSFAYCRIYILNGHTYALMARETPDPSAGRLKFPYNGGGLASLSEEQRTLLRNDIFATLDKSFMYTLGPTRLRLLSA